MTLRSAPDWLAALQTQLSTVLRTPLDSTSGTFCPRPNSYPQTLVGQLCPPVDRRGPSGLEVYNRQYWFRLFSVAQDLFPLTARLLGLWSFNHVVQRFLLVRAPQHPDLRHALDGFGSFLRSLPVGTLELRQLPLPALAEAAALDEAWARVWFAPEATRWQPSPEDAANLAAARLWRSPNVELVHETWPLLRLRREVKEQTDERAIPLPAPHEHPRTWALVRSDHVIAVVPLNALEARLAALLEAHSLGQALQQLEREHSAAEPPLLAKQVQTWLAETMRLGFWRGVTFDPPA